MDSLGPRANARARTERIALAAIQESTMTSTNPSEPSDEGESGPIECICDDDMYTRRNLHRDECWEKVRARAEAGEAKLERVSIDFTNACDVGRRLESRLTEARAELERVKAQSDEWQRSAQAELTIMRELEQAVLRGNAMRYAVFLDKLNALRATPPSPPAAVEAKPADRCASHGHQCCMLCGHGVSAPDVAEWWSKQSLALRLTEEGSEVLACPECRSRETGYRRSVPLGSGWVACPNAWHQQDSRPARLAPEDGVPIGVAPAVENTGRLSGTPAQEQPASPKRIAAMRKVGAFGYHITGPAALERLADELERGGA
jgi:hypothetical protein